MKLSRIIAALAIILHVRISTAQSFVGDLVRLRTSTLPTTCNTGDIRHDTAATGQIKVCRSNAWYSFIDLGTSASADTVLTHNGTTASWTKIVNAHVASTAAIAYSKLNLTASIVNADVATNAAITYSKLNLTDSILNADISSTAAIAYSKLNLTSSIVNADVSNTAGIAYSKLNLTASIVNADVAATAAIAYSKLNLTASVNLAQDVTGILPIVNGGTGNTAGTIPLSKLSDAAANNTLANTTFSQVWNWNTLSNQTAMALNATALTTGTLLNLNAAGEILALNGTITSTAAETDVFDARVTFTPSTSSGVAGVVLNNNYLTATGTASYSYIYGSYIESKNMSTGTISTIVGLQGVAINTASNVVGNLIATSFIANNAGGTVSFLAAGDYEALIRSGSVTDAVALYTYNLNQSATITNRYGLWYDNTSGSATNDWGLFIDGGTKNFIDGSVSIGLQAGTAKVHQDSGTATATYHKFTAGGTTGTTSTDGFDSGVNASGVAELRNYESTAMTFYTNNAEKMRIQPTGEIGMGSTAPTAFIHVASSYTTTNSSFQLFSGTLLSSVTSIQRGLYANPTFNPTGATISNIFGIDAQTNIAATSTLSITNVNANRSIIVLQSGYTGTVATGVNYAASSPTNNTTVPFTAFTHFSAGASDNGDGAASGTVTNRGFRDAGITASSNGATLNNRALDITMPSGGATAGTTNNRGIHITGNGGAAAGGTVVNFALYSDSTVNSYMQGSLGLGTTAPVTKAHINGGNTTATYAKFTNGTSTGVTATDGFDVGINSTAGAEIRQYENNSITFFTNNATAMAIGVGGTIDTTLALGPVYADTNGFLRSVGDGTANQVLSTNGSGTFSWATLIGASFSSSADMTAATSTATSVSPGRQIHHPTMPKAWGSVRFSGSTISVVASYGIASVTSAASATWNVSLSTAMASTAYAAFISCRHAAGAAAQKICNIDSANQNTTNFRFRVNLDEGTATTAEQVDFMIFGAL